MRGQFLLNHIPCEDNFRCDKVVQIIVKVRTTTISGFTHCIYLTFSHDCDKVHSLFQIIDFTSVMIEEFITDKYALGNRALILTDFLF